MLIDKFSTFERLTESNSLEDAKALLESEGFDISEGILDSMKNYFSRLLGGKVKKLDNVLKRYRQSEDQYWDNWIKARNKFYEADAMSRASHEEREKYEEMRERAEKYEKQVEDTRKNVREALEKQAKILVADNQRLTDYWEFNKAVTDEQVAKETLAAGKRDLSDKNALDEIQKRVEAATKRAGEKSKDFQEKYSNDFNKNNFTNQEDLVDLDMEKLRAMSAANLTDIRKSLEGRLNRIKADYDDKMSDIKKELEFIEKNSPDYELHSKSARKKTQDLFNRFTKEREDLKKKIEAIDNLITSQRLGGTNVADKITENPKNITDVGKRELGQEGVKAAVTDAVAQAPAPTVAKIEDLLEDKVQHYFEQGKILVEDNLGKPIDAKHYQHLVNDLVKLFGRLTIYYKEKSEKEQVSGRIRALGLLEFAADLYKRKMKMGQAAADLSKEEIENQFKIYSKEN